MTVVNDAKAALRARAKAKRAQAHAAFPDAGEALARHLLSQDGPLTGIDPPAVISGTWPIRDEIDPRPAMTALLDLGYRLSLPVVETQGTLSFRAWTPNVVLVTRRFGIAEPGEDAASVTPAVLLVPLLAFDRRGARLGYGKGHYDRTLTQLREKGPVRAIGVAYAAQEVDAVPVEDHDVPLDWIVTERERIRCRD